MARRRIPGDGFGVEVEKFAITDRRLRELEAPTGTSLASLYQQVQTQLASIDARVTAAIAANSYTKSQVDNLIANPPGNVSVAGTLTSAGLLKSDVGITSLDIRNRVLTSSYAVVYVDGSGRLGIVPSTRALKTIDASYKIDSAKFLGLPAYAYHYKADGSKRMVVGMIAEDLEAAGFEEYLIRDAETGALQGIRTELMVVGLHSAVAQAAAVSATDRQQLNDRLAAIEARADAAAARRKFFEVTKTLGAISLGGTAQIAVTWPAAMVDTDYLVSASVSQSGVVIGTASADEVPGTRTTAGVTINVYSSVALLANRTLTVRASHA